MPKKTARRPVSPGDTSFANRSRGLIAKAGKSPRSARTKCALDNLSHRTDSVKLQRIKQNRALDVSASERLRAYSRSAASFNAC